MDKLLISLTRKLSVLLIFFLLNFFTLAKAEVFNVPANDTNALIQAVNDSANTPGSDDINLGGGVYTLIDGSLELINLTMNGNGSIIEGGSDNNPCDDVGNEFSVIIVNAVGIDGGPVVLNDLTVREGCSNFGGGINNEGFLTLNNVDVTQNGFKNCGGGIFVDEESTLNINDSNISNNSSMTMFDDPAPSGAGICNFGSATITGSNINNNLAEGNGGAIFNDGSLTIEDSTISNNTAMSDGDGSMGGGGGIINLGLLNLSNTEITNNISADNGGGLHNGMSFFDPGGTANISDSLISGNTAQNEAGGGIYHDGVSISLTNILIINNSSNTNGGGVFSASQLFVRESSFVSNTATNNGGGLFLTTSSPNIVNSTISGNMANMGGGIFGIDFNDIDIENSTITNNSEGINSGDEEFEFDIDINNSIIADNIGADCSGMGIIDSLGFNIDSDNTCNLDATGDMPNSNPLIGPLADNGGPTPTHGLLAESPAINMGDPNGCFDSTRESISTIDQRGFIRPVGGRCDIGAFELQNGEVIDPVVDGFEAGDANGDGSVNVLDIAPILNEFFGIGNLTGDGDCNQDGSTNTIDISCVLNMFFGN